MEKASVVKSLTVAHAVTVRLGRILNLSDLVRALAATARELAQSERAVVLIADSENATLSITAIDNAPLLPGIFSIYNQHDPVIDAWLANEPYAARYDQLQPDSSGYNLMQALDTSEFYSVPLHEDGELIGVVLVDNPISRRPIPEGGRALLGSVRESAALALANARLHSQLVAERDDRMRELEMMRQIDRELSDTIRLDRVFDLTLDWAMRYTLAQGASLALYDGAADELRFVADLGYLNLSEQVVQLRAQTGGIAKRVARSGHTDVVPDVSFDTAYIPLSSAVQSHMSVPVMREDRVIAVITLESRRLNAFTDEHLEFVAKLAARAGVAIDNARLYAEAVREREKLGRILSEIADIVIVIGIDERVVLINQSARAALRLPGDTDYTGRLASAALAGSPLLPALQRASTSGQIVAEEVLLANDHTYYAEFSPHPEIGWIIVMHDITPVKQTDELKRELVATVSHDLKQPLSVMNGYLELLQMSQRMDARSSNFVNMIHRSIEHMRSLIDDVLDLAKIESGIDFDLQPVPVSKLINDCLEQVKPIADSKTMRIETDITGELPNIAGDPDRLKQIFNNLLGNAIKYTPQEGIVRLSVEQADRSLRFTLKDNGIGISPEDQAHIFDRFYRVRRPETEHIEGTGLGLAIAKKLIEAHMGQIGLESRLGEGTTFYVTLPAYSAPA